MLREIVHRRREDVRSMKAPVGKRTRPIHDVTGSLRIKPVIAEVKKSSPSAGEIDALCDPARQALVYQEAGAGVISVLTEPRYFGGGFSDLEQVCRAVSIPVLCKDFIVDRIQIDTAYALGADMILLIAAALADDEMEILSDHARELGMAVLYEIHSAGEFNRIDHLDPGIVGVNSRDLESMEIDHEWACRVMATLPTNVIRVAESGIQTAEDVRRMAQAGADAFLVGSALMRAQSPGALLKEFSMAAGGMACS